MLQKKKNINDLEVSRRRLQLFSFGILAGWENNWLQVFCVTVFWRAQTPSSAVNYMML